MRTLLLLTLLGIVAQTTGLLSGFKPAWEMTCKTECESDAPFDASEDCSKEDKWNASRLIPFVFQGKYEDEPMQLRNICETETMFEHPGYAGVVTPPPEFF
jgi:hypothetical protein